MSLFILDTDHLVLLAQGHAAVTQRCLGVPAGDLAISIVSIEEQLGGWYTMVRKARHSLDRLERAYRGLSQTIEIAASLRVVPFTRAALERHVELKRSLRRVGRMDLAIAAIALEHGATIVTRNRSDFEQVPGLLIEDWST